MAALNQHQQLHAMLVALSPPLANALATAINQFNFVQGKTNLPAIIGAFGWSPPCLNGATRSRLPTIPMRGGRACCWWTINRCCYTPCTRFLRASTMYSWQPPGRKHWNCAAENPPDLILLDVEIPTWTEIGSLAPIKAQPRTEKYPHHFCDRAQRHRGRKPLLGCGASISSPNPSTPEPCRPVFRCIWHLKFQADLLRKMAFVDGSTLVANRRFFDDRLAMEWRRCQRNNLALSLLMIDVDYFKRYNDHYGHQMGDQCLRQVASCLKHHTARPFDLVARYGGEEFACLLPETGWMRQYCSLKNGSSRAPIGFAPCHFRLRSRGHGQHWCCRYHPDNSASDSEEGMAAFVRQAR